MTVYLVGAGPGDPGLLTWRGADVLALADVVVHDGSSVAEVLDLAPAGAERIDVGGSDDRPPMRRSDVTALLVEHARAGRHVVRLMVGDPFLFASGGEEAAALHAAGIGFEVVPGVASDVAVPAYAGIPVTSGDATGAVFVLRGDEAADVIDAVDWAVAMRSGATLVVLAGEDRIVTIVDRLLTAGMPPDTPAAAVHAGTTPGQRTVRSTVQAIVREPLVPPGVVVIGAVAATDLGWFESRPLLGRRVVVTRPRHQASHLVDRLRDEGAATISVPTIDIVDPEDAGVALGRAVADLASYDWVVFTSANGAERFCERLRDARDLGGRSLAAIGPGTADVLADHNLVADLVPERFLAESLLEAFPLPRPDQHGRVLLARAAVARDVLPDGLREMGWRVDVVDAYRTVPVVPTAEQRERVRGADIVTFTSASTVENWVAAFGTDDLPAMVACIGPITADAARRSGVRVDLVADVHTIDGLVDAIVERVAHPRVGGAAPRSVRRSSRRRFGREQRRA